MNNIDSQLLEKEVRRQYLKDYERAVEIDDRPAGSKNNSSNKDMIGIRFPHRDDWRPLLEKTRKYALGSNEFYTSLAFFYHLKEDKKEM